MGVDWKRWVDRDGWPWVPRGYVFLPDAINRIAETIGGRPFSEFTLGQRLVLGIDSLTAPNLRATEIVLHAVQDVLSSGHLAILARITTGQLRAIPREIWQRDRPAVYALLARCEIETPLEGDVPHYWHLIVDREHLETVCSQLSQMIRPDFGPDALPAEATTLLLGGLAPSALEQWAKDALIRGVAIRNAEADAITRLGSGAGARDALKAARNAKGIPTTRGRPVGAKSFAKRGN